MIELIQDGVTGAHFTPGDAADLAATVTRMLDSQTLPTLRPAVRECYISGYTPEANYRMLIDLYGRVRKQTI